MASGLGIIDEYALNIFTDGSSYPKKKRAAGVGVCLVWVNESGDAEVEEYAPPVGAWGRPCNYAFLLFSGLSPNSSTIFRPRCADLLTVFTRLTFRASSPAPEDSHLQLTR